MAKKQELVKVKIERKRWGTGALRRARAKTMCCLGFCARVAKVPVKEMINTGYLYNLNTSVDKVFPKLTHARQKHLAGINDSPRLILKEKEEKIKKLGKRAGVVFSFFGPMRADQKAHNKRVRAARG